MVYYKTMGTDQIMYYIVALILGMLMYHMLKSVCGCKTVEGGGKITLPPAALQCISKCNAKTNPTDNQECLSKCLDMIALPALSAH